MLNNYFKDCFNKNCTNSANFTKGCVCCHERVSKSRYLPHEHVFITKAVEVNDFMRILSDSWQWQLEASS
jgi:hypothetical protein